MEVGKIMRIRISARQSDLARLQAYRVGEALKSAGAEEVVFNFRASLGDLNQNDPLWKMPEKGVFTEDFVRDLTEGTADMVVHSWKDLPTLPRTDTEIIATLPRADTRDVLLFRRDRFESVAKSGVVRILTSSPRRSHNLSAFLREYLPFGVKDVSFEPVRGNIPTRLKKLLAQDVEGLIVAKAALDRLIAAPEAEFEEVQSVIRSVLKETRFMVLPLSVNPTAAAQGALAIEIPQGREDLKRLLAKVNCGDTFECVSKERKILASHGGGCHQKIGVNVIRRPYGEVTFLRGLTDAGLVLDEIRLVPAKPLAPKASSAEKIFPREGESATFFEREALPRSEWSAIESAPALWVARENAWPEGFAQKPDQVVWTAGLSTWKKLAQRGVWVSGSAEGLGEHEPERIEALLNTPKVNWTKLTHAGSVEAGGGETMKTVATYRLTPKANAPDIKGRTHFYWMSGSAFDQALKLSPEIKNAHHASGPGNTYRHIRKVLGDNASVEVHLGVEAWRQSVLSLAQRSELN